MPIPSYYRSLNFLGTTIVEGDLLLLAVTDDSYNPNPSDGFVQLQAPSADLRSRVFYKIATAEDASGINFAVNFRGAGAASISAILTVISDVDTANPIDDIEMLTGSGTTISAPTMLPTGENRLLIVVAQAVVTSGAISTPAGMTLVASNPVNFFGVDYNISMFSEVLGGDAGVTDLKTCTKAGAGPWRAVSLLVKGV